MEIDKELCIRCKGKGLCGKPCPILSRFQMLGKIKTEFSGSSPPEVFVGRHNYPNISAGILAPQELGETQAYSSPELWFENNFSIANILRLRGKLIYAKFKANIQGGNNKFLSLMQEISMADRKVDTEIILKKAPSQEIDPDKGTRELVYRKDGLIRFNRDSRQQSEIVSTFSFFNYDKYGRPIEIGEYRGGGVCDIIFESHLAGTNLSNGTNILLNSVVGERIINLWFGFEV